MIIPRVIPVLLLGEGGLVKTVRFAKPTYVGDVVNAVRIFNEKEVDELVVLDILASVRGVPPNYDLIRDIASECFMPVAYGGGIRELHQAEKILSLGIEKVVLSTAAVEDLKFAEEVSKRIGVQSVVLCLDVKHSLLGGYRLYTHSANKPTKWNPVDFAKAAQASGAGELIVNSIDRDGTMGGYDLTLIRQIAEVVTIPVIACGGAGSVAHLREACKAGASAVAAGSMFVFYGPHRAVLITYTPPRELFNGKPAPPKPGGVGG